MAEPEISRYQACGEIDLSLSVEGVEQSGADRLGVGGQVVEMLVAFARNGGRRFK